MIAGRFVGKFRKLSWRPYFDERKLLRKPS
jgi:hypothetical protein